MCFPGAGAAMNPTMITAMQGASVLMAAQSARQQSKATRAAYEYQSAVERNKAAMLEERASDALRRGQLEENKARQRGAQVRGAQRARFAAAGLALDEGSPLNFLLDTEYMTELDADTAADNAAREAWVLRESARTGATNADFLRSRADAESPSSAFGSTLLGGAGTVASSWYNMTRKTKY